MDAVHFFRKNILLSHEDASLLQAIHDLTIDGIAYIFYTEFFENLIRHRENRIWNSIQKDWYIYTKNAYYDLAILSWSKLFGAYSEPTHYLKLLETDKIKKILLEIDILKLNDSHDDYKIQIKNYLLKYAKISNNDFKKNHKIIKDCRDKYISHREYHPERVKEGDVIFPFVNVMKDTFFSLYFILKKIVEALPAQHISDEKYTIIFNIFEDKEKK